MGIHRPRPQNLFYQKSIACSLDDESEADEQKTDQQGMPNITIQDASADDAKDRGVAKAG